MRVLTFTVDAESDGFKLSRFLRAKCGVTSTTLTKLRYTDGGILVNGIPSRTIERIHSGDCVTIRIADTPPAIPLIKSEMALDIIYRDSDILVINKPAGVAMHPSHNHPDGTLTNAVAYLLESEGEQPDSVRAVGRLDKGTSGVALFALNRYAAANLSGNYEKTYLAVAGGAFTGSGTVDAPIYRPDAGKTLRAVGSDGERAVTHWRALKSGNGKTLLEISLETGRTHQIRVHLQSLGAPLTGDDMYGGEKSEYISRPALHCESVTLLHPVTHEELTFRAELPEDMKNLIKNAL